MVDALFRELPVLCLTKGYSCGDWEFKEPVAVGLPGVFLEGGGSRGCLGVGPFVGRFASQSLRPTVPMVVIFELFEFPLPLTLIPEIHPVPIRAPEDADEALHAGVGDGHKRHCLHRRDLQEPPMRWPPVEVKPRILVQTQAPRQSLTRNRRVKPPAKSPRRRRPPPALRSRCFCG